MPICSHRLLGLMQVKFWSPSTVTLLIGPVRSDEMGEDNDRVHAFQIDDAKIDVSWSTLDCVV